MYVGYVLPRQVMIVRTYYICDLYHPRQVMIIHACYVMWTVICRVSIDLFAPYCMYDCITRVRPASYPYMLYGLYHRTSDIDLIHTYYATMYRVR
jgi:hypothetical protein